MRVVVAGAGALGTCYAALLAGAGADVCVLVRPERVATIRAGLRVSGLLEAAASVSVVTRGREAGRADYLVLTTKTQDTPDVLDALRGIDALSVLSLQNGVAKDALLGAAFGKERVIGAACAVGAGLVSPGHARLTMNQGTWVGEIAGGTSERVVRLVAALRAAGLPSWSVPDVRAVEWYKLCALLPGALTTALSRRSYAEMAVHPELSRLFVRLMRETFGVMQAQGLAVTDPPGSLWRFAEWLPAADDVALAGLRAIGERQQATGERNLPSMLQDILAGRRTEAADLIGEVMHQAATNGVAVPAIETCYRLVRGLEDGIAVGDAASARQGRTPSP
jgi:2-dehydropantoate 2-reductase